MEKLIHTSEGDLVVDNPFLILGTRGYYKLASKLPYAWIVTERTIERSKDSYEGTAVVEWLDRFKVAKGLKVKTKGNVGKPHDTSGYRVVSPGDPDYFEVEGY